MSDPKHVYIVKWIDERYAANAAFGRVRAFISKSMAMELKNSKEGAEIIMCDLVYPDDTSPRR